MGTVLQGMALRILGATSAAMSAAIDGFSMWMLAGYGGLIGLMLGQLGEVGEAVDARHIKPAGFIYLVSVLPAVVQ